MRITLSTGSKGDRRGFGRALGLTVVLLVALGFLVAACGGAKTTTTVASVTPTTQAVTTTLGSATTQAVTTTQSVSTTTSTTITALVGETTAPVLSRADIAQLKSDVNAFADAFYGEYGDTKATFPLLADDATFWDPSDGDFLISGKSQIVTMLHGFFAAFPDITAERRAMYISADGAAFAVAENDVWPPNQPEPADHPPVEWGQVFHFKNGLASSWDISLSSESFEMVKLAIFAPGQSGPEQLKKIVDRYVSAWASGDAQRIAALYRTDAVFVDSLRGIYAQGPAAIAQLARDRFGPGQNKTLRVIDLHVQTNGPYPPYEQKPKEGAIIGVGIHYRWTATVNGVERPLDGLTTFELGTRETSSFDLDSNGLIVREEFFYNPDSLLALSDDQWLRFVNPLVSTDWLAANLGRPGLVIIDVRSPATYKAAHIPGSVSIPFGLSSAWTAPENSEIQMELPATKDFFPLLGNAGITPDSTVVVVGLVAIGSPPFALADATRAADTLIWAGVKNVSVLDGGITKWTAEGKPTTKDVPQIKAVKYSSDVMSKAFVSTDYVAEHIGKSIIVDARDAVAYSGPDADAGHIPTAVSLPTPLIWEADGTYKSAETLAKTAADVIGPAQGKEIIVYCGVGGYASSWWFVLTQMLGYQNVKFYDGSAQAWTLSHDMEK